MISEVFSYLVEFIVNIINQLGYFGIFVGMSIESSFFPFPSEIILFPAGIAVSRGEMAFLFVFLAGILGSLFGALINYSIGYYFGRRAVNVLVRKYGKFLFISKENMERSEIFMTNHGEITMFIGRLIPGIRQLISIPAGFGKMNLSKFVAYTLLGAGVWSAILIYLGIVFGNNIEKVHSLLNTITFWVILVAIMFIGLYIWMWKHKKSKIRASA
ncbi:MAG: DedA family protein [Nanoarchaeota archaeon]|nr:DedA family protein [Nanoarchaeota archaeon]